jgi:hypothetical protein
MAKHRGNTEARHHTKHRGTLSYEAEDTCMSHEDEDTCMSCEEEDTCIPGGKDQWPNTEGRHHTTGVGVQSCRRTEATPSVESLSPQMCQKRPTAYAKEPYYESEQLPRRKPVVVYLVVQSWSGN